MEQKISKLITGLQHLGLPVSDLDETAAFYEGGGFSETKENRKRSALEHKVITRYYQGWGKSTWFAFLMLVSLAPLRTWIAENPALAGFYNKVKSAVYGRRK